MSEKAFDLEEFLKGVSCYDEFAHMRHAQTELERTLDNYSSVQCAREKEVNDNQPYLAVIYHKTRPPKIRPERMQGLLVRYYESLPGSDLGKR